MSLIPDYDWRGWKPLFAIATLLIALFGIERFDPCGWKNANLQAVPPPQPQPRWPMDQESEPDDSAYVPYRDRSYTQVGYHNDGERRGLIQAVSFDIERVKETPRRFPKAGAMEVRVIPINFQAKDYNKQDKQFYLPLPTSIQVDGDEFVEFRVAVIIPGWAGKTLMGTLNVHFNGREPGKVRNVELDALKTAPVGEDR